MKAREILRTIPEECRSVLSEFYDITMDIVSGNYDKALERLNKIDKKSLNASFSIIFDNANTLINFYLGKKDDLTVTLNRISQSFRNCLYSSEKENFDLQLKIFFCNLEEKEKISGLKLRRDVDFKKLYDEIQYKISVLNPRYYNFMSSYSIILDDALGYNGDVPLYGVVVETPLGVNRIKNIGLADFSNEFDIEGKSTDKDLRKRLLVK